MVSNMNIISVDIGTSRIKTAYFDESGEMSCLLSQRLDRAASPNTQDADEWFSVTAGLLKELVSHCNITPDAVVLTGNMHALLGVDSFGNPVAPAVLWSDNSAQDESSMLNKHYENELITMCGNQSTPVFTLPKIMQMKRLRCDLYNKVCTFMQSKDYITFKLTGKRVTDPTDASGVLGMELHKNRWAKDFFADLNIDAAKLPDILPSASVCGYVTAEAAALTGITEGTPVVTGTGDLASAATGSGVNIETLSLTLGTAGQLLACGPIGGGCKLAKKLFVFAHSDPQEELYLGSVPSGGFSFEWFSKLHNISVPEFFKLADSVPLAFSQPVFMPYILGRGAPYMDYAPAGAWHKLNANHQLADLCRGAVFGALCPLRQCTDLLETLTGPRKNIVLQALACREKAVRDCASALFRQEKFIPENSEASLLGAAVAGTVAMKCYSSIAEASEKMIKKTKITTPEQTVAQELFKEFLAFASN